MDMSKQLLLPSTDNLPSFFRPETISETPCLGKKPSLDLDAAPIFDLDQEWQHSLFGRSIQECHRNLMHIAEDADMAIGVTDPHGTLLWTWSSTPMRSSAEQVHFVEGGQWSTQAVGQNAIGLALNTHSASCVYSHENQMNSVRDWVCYAAPITDANTGQFYGIMNLST
ncbi:transcriptional regulator, partial [Acinetobacter baumannii]|nr:transcriptional regulator [Acinetobacter baumannii]EKV2141378.1 transcriptional regulator [Acinetobacter baumannii]EKW2955781.1 transcriptional regulator [Acinetobacter baumannii]EKW3173240.1 transcriptional regulator [Acinetobacter baumannii]EKW5946527.1 transcriptional regulator [Acinetobacter baumannii]